mgnify:CR=1 FL=1
MPEKSLIAPSHTQQKPKNSSNGYFTKGVESAWNFGIFAIL